MSNLVQDQNSLVEELIRLAKERKGRTAAHMKEAAVVASALIQLSDAALEALTSREWVSEQHGITMSVSVERHGGVDRSPGRPGSKITQAYAAIPYDPTPLESFAEQHDVSIAVLRQHSRFDPFGDKGKVRTGKDLKTGVLMIWRQEPQW